MDISINPAGLTAQQSGLLSQGVNNLNGGSRFLNPKPLSFQHLLVALGVQITKAFTELNFLSFYFQRPVCALPLPARRFRQVFGIDAKKPLDRKSTRLNSSHGGISRMPSSA